MRRLGRRRARAAGGALFVEGERQVRRALESGAIVRELYTAPPLHPAAAHARLVVIAEQRGARVVELAARAFASIAAQPRPDGLAALVERPRTSLARLRLREPALLLVADAVERAGNLGTIVRTACGAGADGLLACDGRTDVFHPEAVRGSVGTVFLLPIAECAGTAAVAWLRERAVRIVVATPDGELPYWEADLAGPTAIVVGNERRGVSESWRTAADASVRVPLPGPADSVNVAVAAGVVLAEAVRQRLTAS